MMVKLSNKKNLVIFVKLTPLKSAMEFPVLSWEGQAKMGSIEIWTHFFNFGMKF